MPLLGSILPFRVPPFQTGSTAICGVRATPGEADPWPTPPTLWGLPQPPLAGPTPAGSTSLCLRSPAGSILPQCSTVQGGVPAVSRVRLARWGRSTGRHLLHMGIPPPGTTGGIHELNPFAVGSILPRVFHRSGGVHSLSRGPSRRGRSSHLRRGSTPTALAGPPGGPPPPAGPRPLSYQAVFAMRAQSPWDNPWTHPTPVPIQGRGPFFVCGPSPAVADLRASCAGPPVGSTSLPLAGSTAAAHPLRGHRRSGSPLRGQSPG
ncbi:hypothetical protein FNV43_RR21839 [Rhamnella rubrinervis]|uniref:Uncharacterized protein n=1 Tax=Rhamnella rubrinervis TaxID=2594499 RepID=A0A8K0GQH9_9ROSA|nr:hypothetical protein FNV43_RR21839 [Rhamnella rubrinervis]